jgi:hypothetical protein
MIERKGMSEERVGDDIRNRAMKTVLRVRMRLSYGENGVHNEETKKTKTNEEDDLFAKRIYIFVRLRYLRFFVVNSVFSVTSEDLWLK